MFLRKLKLSNFKNHPSGDFEFTKKFNVFVGKNGVGKTNLLDLIHFICLTKSFNNLTDQQLILKEQPFLRVEAELDSDEGAISVEIKLAQNKRKEFRLNDQLYSKIADHIGKIPLILISPEDSDLINESSEVRRKLIDTVLSQYDRKYLDALMNYYKVLEQRNSLLKQIAEKPGTDKSSLDFYDLKLSEYGTYIYMQRKKLFESLQPVFTKYYTEISDNAEQVSWLYESQLNSISWNELFRQRREKDLIMQRTTGGIHRDDLEFQINDDKIRKFGSQGQQKSFLIALKLALYEIVANQSSSKPILLIDDIFDKLDRYRMKRLLKVLQQDVFGQIFITDTDISRISESFDIFHAYVEVFRLDKSLSDN